MNCEHFEFLFVRDKYQISMVHHTRNWVNKTEILVGIVGFEEIKVCLIMFRFVMAIQVTVGTSSKDHGTSSGCVCYFRTKWVKAIQIFSWLFAVLRCVVGISTLLTDMVLNVLMSFINVPFQITLIIFYRPTPLSNLNRHINENI